MYHFYIYLCISLSLSFSLPPPLFFSLLLSPSLSFSFLLSVLTNSTPFLMKLVRGKVPQTSSVTVFMLWLHRLTVYLAD